MQIEVIYTVKKTVEVPNNLKDEDEIKEYLHTMYDDGELVKYPDEVIIEEIAGYPVEPDEYDKWVDNELERIERSFD